MADSLVARLLAAIRSINTGGQQSIAYRFRYPTDDDRPGREWDARLISAPPNAGTLLGNNPRRWAFAVQGNGGSAFRIWPKPMALANEGIPVQTTSLLLFTRADWGGMISAEWQYSTTIGATSFVVLEVF